MLPAIGSISILPSHGRAGVVMGAHRLGDDTNGQQLVALKIRAEAHDGPQQNNVSRPTGHRPDGVMGNDRVNPAADAIALGPTSAKRLDQLSAPERADISRLQQRDQQVRQEETAHAAVAGDLAGPINYIYERGPDGRQYAVGGSVSVRAKTVSGDPEEAKRQSGRLAAAAHAATSPSAQDLATARMAYDFASRSTAETNQNALIKRVDISV